MPADVDFAAGALVSEDTPSAAETGGKISRRKRLF
jgi:hypothetical protein